MVNLGKFVQDLLLWSTRDRFLRLPTPSCSPRASSQKRNPVSLEHVRILASRAIARPRRFCCARTTPLSAISRRRRHPQPLVFTMSPTPCAGCASGAFSHRQVDRNTGAGAPPRILSPSRSLRLSVRHTGMVFARPHALVARAVEASGADDRPAPSPKCSCARIHRRWTRAFVERRLDPKLVRIRQVPGGPAPDVVAESLSLGRRRPAGNRSWIRFEAAVVDARAATVRKP